MRTTPAVSLTDIHKQFDTLQVLKGVSLEAHDGDVIAVIGSSGSGKSTMLRCINGLEIPDTGEVWVAGESIAFRPAKRGGREVSDRAQLDRVRSSVGMVFQSFNLWSHMTVLGNVMEGPVHVQKRDPSTVRAEAQALLAKVGIAEKAEQYPAQLSGGQQQRVAIARALAMQPKLMLFDEPTSALDPELVGEVLRVIRDLAREGRTMILVTHEMAFAREVANRVIFLHQGKIEEDGSPEQVFGAPKSERCRQFVSNQLR